MFLALATLALSVPYSGGKSAQIRKKKLLHNRILLEKIYRKELNGKDDEKSHESEGGEGFVGFMKSTPGIILLIVIVLLLILSIVIVLYCLFRKNVLSFGFCKCCCSKKIDPIEQYGQVILDDSDDQEFFLQPL